MSTRRHEFVLSALLLAGWLAPNLAGAENPFKVLARATPQQVAAQYAFLFRQALDQALKSGDSTYDMEVVTEEIKKGNPLAQPTPEDLKRLAPEYLLKEIEKSYVDNEGYVVDTYMGWSSMAYDAFEKDKEVNALEAAGNPAGVDLEKINDQWKKVGVDSVLDRGFVYPVVFKRMPDYKDVVDALRKLGLGSRFRLVARDEKAVEKFSQAKDGPSCDPLSLKNFAPISWALQSRGIKRRYYFYEEGYAPEFWNQHLLIVVDEHRQMWGMYMGYSK